MVNLDMRASVIIPTMCGREDSLKRAIHSIQESAIDFEIVVSARRFQFELLNFETDFLKHKIKLVLHDGVGNAASNRNIAIEHASGEYIAFLDDDDEFLPEKLTIQIKAMENAGVHWSFSNYWLVNEARGGNRHFLSARSMLRKRIDLDKNCAIATPTVIIKRDVLRHHDLKFNSNFENREDIDLWKRLLNIESVLYIPRALSVVNRSSSANFQENVRDSFIAQLFSRSFQIVAGATRRCFDMVDVARSRNRVIAYSDSTR